MAFGSYRYRDPGSPPGAEDAIAVLEVVLAELDDVEQHEEVRLVDLVEEPKPGKVLGLVDGNDQGCHSEWMGKVRGSQALVGNAATS